MPEIINYYYIGLIVIALFVLVLTINDKKIFQSKNVDNIKIDTKIVPVITHEGPKYLDTNIVLFKLCNIEEIITVLIQNGDTVECTAQINIVNDNLKTFAKHTIFINKESMEHASHILYKAPGINIDDILSRLITLKMNSYLEAFNIEMPDNESVYKLVEVLSCINIVYNIVGSRKEYNEHRINIAYLDDLIMCIHSKLDPNSKSVMVNGVDKFILENNKRFSTYSILPDKIPARNKVSGASPGHNNHSMAEPENIIPINDF